jgi:hypothetical protein
MHRISERCKIGPKQNILILLGLGIVITIGLTSTADSGFATENNTLTQPRLTQNMSNTTNIVLVHGGRADGGI